MNCRTCCSEIEPERLAILPNTVFCASCSNKYNVVKPRKGIMVYEHKTGSYLQTMAASDYEVNKKYFKANGARSVVKNFSKNVCS